MKVSQYSPKDMPKYVLPMLYAYLFIYYVRPQDNVPGLSIFNVIHWVGILFLVVTVYGFSRFKSEFLKVPVALVFWLGVWFAVSGIGAYAQVSFKISLKWMLWLFPQCVAIYAVFSTHDNVKKLIKLWCVIYLFLGLTTLKNAPRGAGDFTWDPNDAALALSMGLPFAVYAMQLKELGKPKLYLFICVVIVAGVVMTESRGGFLGLVAVVLTIWWLSKNRMKYAFYSILFAAVAGIFILQFLPSDYISQVKSIDNPKDLTRVERIHTWEISWIMFKHHPFWGVGAGNFIFEDGKYERETSWWTGNEKSLAGRVAHSLYFQVLPELGIFGFLMYCYAIVYAPLKLLRLRKCFENDENERVYYLLCNILVASMAGYAIAGAFIAVAYYPHVPMWITMYAMVTKRAKELNALSLHRPLKS